MIKLALGLWFTAVLAATGGGCSDKPIAPSGGIVTGIVPNHPSCTAKSQMFTTLLTYRPNGTQPDGSVWPQDAKCLTPDQASRYTVGGKY
jgi:hypothetical protein